MLVPPSFIHQDARQLELLCLSLPRSLSQISFQTEAIEAWNRIPNHNELVSQQRGKRREERKMARVKLWRGEQKGVGGRGWGGSPNVT